MKHFVIPPLAHNELSRLGTGGLFVLAHLYIKDEQYRKYVLDRKLAGDFIILDNGAAENSTVTSSLLLKCVEEILPNEVIAPDVLFDSEETMCNFTNFLQLLHEHQLIQKGVRLLGCPQGRSLGQWLECYDFMVSHDEVTTIGMSKIALPFAIFRLKGDQKIKESRHIAFDLLKSSGRLTKPLHFLGMGDPREYIKYLNEPLVRSTDSCLACWSAFNDKDWWSEEHSEFERIPTPHNYFDLKFNSIQKARSEQNAQWLTNALSTESNHLGTRYNNDKAKLSLLDFCTLEQAARVLEFGSKKYDRDNWKKGFIHSEIVDSILRHISSYQQGDSLDKESNLRHTAHILCNAMFLCYMDINKPQLNDFKQ